MRHDHPTSPSHSGQLMPYAEQSGAAPAAPPLSLIGLLRLRAGAWVAERATEAEIRVLTCHTRLVQARATLAEATFSARLTEAKAALAAEAEERELMFQRLVSRVPTETAREIIGADTEIERLLLERERLRRERRVPSPVPAPATLPVAQTYTLPALTVAVSAEQIRQLATRAFARFAQLPPAKAERAWEAWERETRQRLPRLAAEDVIAQAAELRRLG